MPFRQDIFQGILFVNRGPNGWSERYPLGDYDLTTAATDFAEIVQARSYILAAGCEIVWACVRQYLTPRPSLAILASPLASLLKPDTTPFWRPPHDDFSGPMVTLETDEGRWSNRILHGLAGDEITANEWIRGGLVVPAGPVAAPAVPNLATKDELFTYFLATLRDKTRHAKPLKTGTGGHTDWDLSTNARVMYREITKSNVGERWDYVSWEPDLPSEAPYFSPCGSRVAVLRRAYQAPCRFYNNAPPFKIRWFFVPETAAMFPLPTIFWPYSQDGEYANLSGVGEYTGKGNRVYSLGYSLSAPPGDHYEGTPADFLGQSAIPWTPALPTPSFYRLDCFMSVPLPIKVFNIIGGIVDSNVTDIYLDDPLLYATLVAPGQVALHVALPTIPPTLTVSNSNAVGIDANVDTMEFDRKTGLYASSTLAGFVKIHAQLPHPTPTNLIADVEDLDPGESNLVYLFMVGTTRKVGSLAGGYAGRKVYIRNTDAVDLILLKRVTVGPVPGRQYFLTDDDLVLQPEETVEADYRPDGYWHVTQDIRYAEVPNTDWPKAFLTESALGNDVYPNLVRPGRLTEMSDYIKVDGHLVENVGGSWPLGSVLDPSNNRIMFMYDFSSNDLDGILASVRGRWLTLIAQLTGASPITVKHNSGSAGVGEKINCPNAKDVVLQAYEAVELYYSGTGWVVVGISKNPAVNSMVESPIGIIDGINATFVLSYAPAGSVLLFVNGVLQAEGVGNDFTIVGNTITFEPGSIPATGSSITASYSY